MLLAVSCYSSVVCPGDAQHLPRLETVDVFGTDAYYIVLKSQRERELESLMRDFVRLCTPNLNPLSSSHETNCDNSVTKLFPSAASCQSEPVLR
jgi:hypothetical protein